MKHEKTNSYAQLALELVIDFVIMYLVMYTMIFSLKDFHFNLNSVYMTFMMVAAMTIVMLYSMRSMYPSQHINLILSAVAAIIFILSFSAMRTQAAIGDAELIRAMIPHHSGAILMCERAKLKDPEIIALCKGIIDGQKKEITQMETILSRL